jgi:Mrp family chromosome partitioning ATPase
MANSRVVASLRSPGLFGQAAGAQAPTLEQALVQRTRTLRPLPPAVMAEAERLVDHVDLTLPGVISRVIGVTSATAGEGVSTVVCAVAVVLAERARGAILVVDTNRHRPLLKGTNRPGLVEVLLGECELDDAIETVPETPISLLTSGDPRVDVSGRVDESRMRATLAALRSRFAYTLLDLPAFADAVFTRRVSAVVDGTVVVVQAHGPARARVAETIDGLKAAGANVLGVALTSRLGRT